MIELSDIISLYYGFIKRVSLSASRWNLNKSDDVVQILAVVCKFSNSFLLRIYTFGVCDVCV